MDEVVKGEVVKEENGLEATQENEIVLQDANGIRISEEVVATIASYAASEVSGVVSMNATGLDIFKKTKGIKVTMTDKTCNIDISITVEYGTRIPDVCWEVQNKVGSQVELMTGLKVTAVNINVLGISIPKKGKDDGAAETTNS